MKLIRLFGKLAIPCAILALPNAWAAAQNQAQTAPGRPTGQAAASHGASNKGMSAAAKKLAADKKALALSHRSAIQTLTQSPQWKTMTAEQRREALQSLNQKFVTQEHTLNAAYKAEVRKFSARQQSRDKSAGSSAGVSAPSRWQTGEFGGHGMGAGAAGGMGGGHGR
jgi:predicted Fe-S protein YdhL (DUF1289 family)